MLAGDAVEDLEIYYILYRLREAGYAVDVAAPTRRTMRTVVHDFEPDSDAYVERPGRRLEPDLAFSEVEPERYVGVVIPGGRAPEYIRVDSDVKRIVSHFFDNDLPVGTLCHGPQVPAALGYLQGRKTSGFPPLAPDIEAAGGTTPGNAARSPGSPFNEPGINSQNGGIGGQHYSERSQYDVACYHVSQH